MTNIEQLKNMYESIKNSLNTKTTNASYKDYLKTEVGKSYLVRIIPNVKNPEDTFFHYRHHGFTSYSTGQYVDGFCPGTLEERCPICEYRLKLYKKGDDSSRDTAFSIRTHEKHLANVYVIDDPSNPENNGTIKVLRFGKSLHNKILRATIGDDADEFGYKIYDLSDKGCNFKITVDTASESGRKFTNYNDSRFTSPGAIPGMTKEKMMEVYDNIFDLRNMVEIKSTKEMDEILSRHILCTHREEETPPKENPRLEKSTIKSEKMEQDTFLSDDDTNEGEETSSQKSCVDDIDEKIKDLLDGLDDLPF